MKIPVNQGLCEIYNSYANDDNFAVGTILAADKHFILSRGLDEVGRLDSYVLFARSEIRLIKQKTPYLKGVGRMAERQKELGGFDVYQRKLPDELAMNTNDLLREAMRWAVSKEQLLTIGLRNNDELLTGVLREVQGEIRMSLMDETLDFGKSMPITTSAIMMLEFLSVTSAIVTPRA